MANGGIRVEGAADIIRKLELLGDRSKHALSWSINESLKHARTVSNRQIRKEVAAKAGQINKALIKKTAKPSYLTGSIETASKGRPLSTFTFSVLKRGGVSVKVRPKGGRLKLPEARVIPARVMRYSRIIFLAEQMQNRRLDWLYGPSISQVWTGVRDDDLEEFAEFFNRRLIYRIGYEMERLR